MGSQLVTTQFSRLVWSHCTTITTIVTFSISSASAQHYTTGYTLQGRGVEGGGRACSIMSHVSFGVHIIWEGEGGTQTRPGKCIFIEGSVAYH